MDTPIICRTTLSLHRSLVICIKHSYQALEIIASYSGKAAASTCLVAQIKVVQEGIESFVEQPGHFVMHFDRRQHQLVDKDVIENLRIESA